MDSSFDKFAFLLNEEKSGEGKPSGIIDVLPDFGVYPNETEDLIKKMGQLLMGKLRAHSGLEPALFTPKEVLKKNGKSLAPIMYRIATENFIKTSKATFKIIECRNATKLVTDWKPRVPDILISLGHQVVVVELKESFSPYNDFAYAVLRQINYNWRIRLPKSFFYPDDVCSVESTIGEQLLLVTPSMPDGEMDMPDRIKKTLQYDILMMLKASCDSAMENHLLMRDLRVGKFAETFDGVSSIRSIYRSLQKRVRDGKEISLGTSSTHDGQLYMLSGAGDTIMSAEALLKECKQDYDGGETGKGGGEEIGKNHNVKTLNVLWTSPILGIGKLDNETASGKTGIGYGCVEGEMPSGCHVSGYVDEAEPEHELVENFIGESTSESLGISNDLEFEYEQGQELD